jgi:hypothetical protein
MNNLTQQQKDNIPKLIKFLEEIQKGGSLQFLFVSNNSWATLYDTNITLHEYLNNPSLYRIKPSEPKEYWIIEKGDFDNFVLKNKEEREYFLKTYPNSKIIHVKEVMDT